MHSANLFANLNFEEFDQPYDSLHQLAEYLMQIENHTTDHQLLQCAVVNRLCDDEPVMWDDDLIDLMLKIPELQHQLSKVDRPVVQVVIARNALNACREYLLHASDLPDTDETSL